MGFLDDLVNVVGDFLPPLGYTGPQQPQPPQIGAPPPGEDYWGLRPGFDIGDIGEFLGRIGAFPFNIGEGGYLPAVQPGARRGPPEIGAGPPQLGNGNGAAGGRLQTTGARTAMYIAGNCPGLWHTTPVRPLYDRHTGQFLRDVGGNRVANRVSLVQDDSGALEFVSPVKATWSLKYKSRGRARRTYRKKMSYSKSYHRAPRKRGHRHSLTRKQLSAGFGGKAHMKAHR